MCSSCFVDVIVFFSVLAYVSLCLFHVFGHQTHPGDRERTPLFLFEKKNIHERRLFLIQLKEEGGFVYPLFFKLIVLLYKCCRCLNDHWPIFCEQTAGTHKHSKAFRLNFFPKYYFYFTSICSCALRV